MKKIIRTLFLVVMIMIFLIFKIPNITPQKCETDVINLHNQVMTQTTSGIKN